MLIVENVMMMTITREASGFAPVCCLIRRRSVGGALEQVNGSKIAIRKEAFEDANSSSGNGLYNGHYRSFYWNCPTCLPPTYRS